MCECVGLGVWEMQSECESESEDVRVWGWVVRECVYGNKKSPANAAGPSLVQAES